MLFIVSAVAIAVLETEEIVIQARSYIEERHDKGTFKYEICFLTF